MSDGAVAVVAGVGPGLGLAVSNRFADAGCRVAMLARRADALEAMAAARSDGRLLPFPCDVTEAEQVEETFARIGRELGVPECVVFNAGGWVRIPILDLDPETFERSWRAGCFGGFLVGRAAARAMVPAGHGTILFTGATASLRGGAGFAAFAAGKFGLRAVAQSMARELGPQGIHVAHVVIDGQIMSPRYARLAAERGPDALLDPAAIAEVYHQLHLQPRSAWTFELELRPWCERF
ncbi:SDR family NAD(P)-dependent oxidoreductase [Benzoatithermus flavus]|uniref:SDR family NAD(P)-dependent oxidoreductase n=1 Tax=Benzoatithermus flavus TaxID=3108223 RepID=A0ABU8XWM1_9PROT